MNTSTPWFAGTPEAAREAKVDAGLALMDAKLGADKVNAIDLEKLDLTSNAWCALAQAAETSFHNALGRVGLGDNQDAVPFGFVSSVDSRQFLRHRDDIERRTAIFRRKINQRRIAAAA